jgi:hypothetical protein
MYDGYRPPACFAVTRGSDMRGSPLCKRGVRGDFATPACAQALEKSPLPPFDKGGFKAPLPCAA